MATLFLPIYWLPLGLVASIKILDIETHEATDVYFNSSILEQIFKNNKVVAPVDFEFFYTVCWYYIYIIHYYTSILFLPSDSVVVLILVDYYLEEANDFYYE